MVNEQWKQVEHIIISSPPSKDPIGWPVRDPREVLNQILWIMRTGSGWFYLKGIRHTRRAIGSSSNAFVKECFGALPRTGRKPEGQTPYIDALHRILFRQWRLQLEGNVKKYFAKLK